MIGIVLLAVGILFLFTAQHLDQIEEKLDRLLAVIEEDERDNGNI